MNTQNSLIPTHEESVHFLESKYPNNPMIKFLKETPGFCSPKTGYPLRKVEASFKVIDELRNNSKIKTKNMKELFKGFYSQEDSTKIVNFLLKNK